MKRRSTKSKAKGVRKLGLYLGAGLLILGLGVGGAWINQTDFSHLKSAMPATKAPVTKAPAASPKKISLTKPSIKKVQKKKAAINKSVAYKPFRSKKIVRVAGK